MRKITVFILAAGIVTAAIFTLAPSNNLIKPLDRVPDIGAGNSIETFDRVPDIGLGNKVGTYDRVPDIG